MANPGQTWKRRALLPTAALLVLSLVLPLGASASAADPGTASGEALTPLAAESLAPPCENYGFSVAVSGTGTADYCGGKRCDNHGYIVTVGSPARACGYRGVAVVCKADTCYTVGGHPTASSMATAEGSDPCGVAEEPVCWTVRYLCPSFGPATERLFEQALGPYLEMYFKPCECQPGDPRCEPASAELG